MEKLRKKAEELLKMKNEELSEKMEDVKKLMHELQVYQIELELQNKEMQESSEKLKTAEHKFFTLFNSAPIAYFLFDFKGIILDCNLKATELLSHRIDVIRRKPMVSYIAEGRKDEFYNFLDDILKSNEQQVAEFSLYNKNRNIIHVEFEATVVQTENILAAAIDITEKKIKDKLLQEALHKAEQSDKLKTDFLNSISHEIRTPLSAITGFSDLLCRENLKQEKRAEYATKIKKGSAQLLKIIEDILVVSQLSNHDIPRSDEKVSVNSLFKELYQLYKLNYASSPIIFVITPMKEDIVIISDYQKLLGIFERLMENAFKFTMDGNIEIGCYTKGKNIIFYVKDTGIGISKEKQKQLFAPFVQIENANVFRSGLGLGLAIAKGYTKLLSGEIWYEQLLPAGSAFYISLPWYSGYIVMEENTKHDDHKIDLTKKTILIAEDEYLNYQLLEEIFSEFDVNLLYAKNGKVAIDLFIQHAVDIVLIDLKMPVMDGIEASRQIRKINKRVPIVALTAHVDMKSKPENNDLFDKFITKPIDIDLTLKTISRLLQ